MKKLLLLPIFLLLFSIKSNSQINLVKDIIPGTSGSSPDMLTDVNGTLFFYPTLINAATFPELWKTDGTEAGTTLVKVLDKTSQGTNYDISFKGALYLFRGGAYFMKSDGTSAGTVLVKTFLNYSTGAVIFQNNLYFSASTVAGTGLYKSDGTAAGTVFVTNKNYGNLVVSGSYIYFEGADNELWRTDGTTSGTVLVKDINPAAGLGGNPTSLIDVNGTLFFRANDGINGLELWKTDGTTTGTVMLKDIMAGSSGTSLHYLTNVNGILYFTKDYDALWRSDGTTAGTTLLKNLSNIQFLYNANGTLFFAAASGVYADNSAYGSELWKSDGTSVGTIMVKDIQPGTNSSGIQEANAIGSTLYFSAINATYGRELWKSDGTEAGTTLVQDRNVGTVWFTPKKLTVSGSKLYMTGTTATEGLELFVYQNSTSNIIEHSLANKVSIYPNPSKGNFTVEIKENAENSKLEIYNSMGKIIFNQPINASKTTINTGLKQGVYFVNIMDGSGKIQSNKMIIE
ncbi:T9SS type A sorting domain-containing protein [bacterium]|nr:T9SS type A sorting domain-containing protein [bacterium]